MDIRCKNCFKIFDNEYSRCPFCGYSEGEPPRELYHLYPGTELLGRYVIGEVLGFGGFGITYKAWDKKFETVLAIKEYYPSGIVNRNPGESEVILFTGKKKDIFDNGLVRFLDEAKNMAKFSQNNNIVNVFEYFEDNNTGYIVMEFLEGISLNSYLLKQTQKLPLEEIMNITLSVCSALRELHAIGIIHRDVSPDNIFMCSNGKIKLIDFGAARFSLNEEKKMTIILKPGFAPPEQYEKINKQGPWTDIYALGATVYLLLTGTKPDESTNRKVNDTVMAPHKMDPTIPEHVSYTIMKSIALDRKNRFNTIEKFEKALLKKTKVSGIKPSKTYSPSTSKSSTISSIAVIIVLVLGIGFSVFYIMANKKESLDKCSLTLWYTYNTNEDMEAKLKALNSSVEKFASYYPKVTINLQGIANNEYKSKVKEAISTGSEPNIYDTTSVENSIIADAVDVDEILKKIKLDEYHILNSVKNETGYSYKLPLGLNVPVIYANSDVDGGKLEKLVMNSINDIGNGTDSLENLVGVNSQYSTFYEKAFSKESRFSEKFVTNGALNKFVKDEIPFYFSTTEDYRYIQKNLSDSYYMSYIKVKSGYNVIKYSDCFSISNRNSSKEQKKAAIVFMKFLLSREGQEILYIDNNNNAIPLNKKSYEEYCDVNKELRTILENVDEIK